MAVRVPPRSAPQVLLSAINSTEFTLRSAPQVLLSAVNGTEYTLRSASRVLPNVITSTQRWSQVILNVISEYIAISGKSITYYSSTDVNFFPPCKSNTLTLALIWVLYLFIITVRQHYNGVTTNFLINYWPWRVWVSTFLMCQAYPLCALLNRLGTTELVRTGGPESVSAVGPRKRSGLKEWGSSCTAGSWAICLFCT